jgi:hypothetical protein
MRVKDPLLIGAAMSDRGERAFEIVTILRLMKVRVSGNSAHSLSILSRKRVVSSKAL